jgi:hypothetical protein
MISQNAASDLADSHDSHPYVTTELYRKSELDPVMIRPEQALEAQLSNLL